MLFIGDLDSRLKFGKAVCSNENSESTQIFGELEAVYCTNNSKHEDWKLWHRVKCEHCENDKITGYINIPPDQTCLVYCRNGEVKNVPPTGKKIQIAVQTPLNHKQCKRMKTLAKKNHLYDVEIKTLN